MLGYMFYFFKSVTEHFFKKNVLGTKLLFDCFFVFSATTITATKGFS